MGNEERMAYRPNEAARVIGLSRDMIFKAIHDGSLRSLKIGHARLITAEALREYVRHHEQATQPAGVSVGGGDAAQT